MYSRFYILLFFVAVITANTYAQETVHKFYVIGNVGAFIPANKFKEKDESFYITKKPKKGTIYSIGVGYVVSDHWRGDLNFGHRYLKYKAEEIDEDGDLNEVAQKVKTYSIFLNGYYDLNIHKTIKPYLTAGLGYSCNNSSSLMTTFNGGFDDDFPGKKTNNLSWNIGIGTRFILNDRFNLDVFYKYTDLGKVRTKNGVIDIEALGGTQKITSHDIMGGVIVHL